MKIIFTSILMLFASLSVAGLNFERGSKEFGIANLSLGYSNQLGFEFHAGARYQYYVLNRVALGGQGFYDNWNRSEWWGVGPVGSYILWTSTNWFARFDQALTLANYIGPRREPSNFYATSSIGLNYFPRGSRFFIGGGYAYSYALDGREPLKPNSFVLTGGWFF